MNDPYITYFQILYKPFKSNGKLSYEQYENTNVSPEINSKTQFSYFDYENDVDQQESINTQKQLYFK